jgi:hypothetical protein
MSFKNDQDQRKAHNEQLVRRMKSGEALWAYDSKASWFPPRPIIEKDRDAIKRLYDGSTANGSQSVYQNPTVQHIEARLQVVKEDKSKQKVESVG